MSYTNTNTNIRTRARYSRRRQAREPDVRDATRDRARLATRRAAPRTGPHVRTGPIVCSLNYMTHYLTDTSLSPHGLWTHARGQPRVGLSVITLRLSHTNPADGTTEVRSGSTRACSAAVNRTAQLSDCRSDHGSGFDALMAHRRHAAGCRRRLRKPWRRRRKSSAYAYEKPRQRVGVGRRRVRRPYQNPSNRPII